MEQLLVKIQNELKVPKGNLNKFGNYKYRSSEDILEAVKPLLLKYDLVLTLSDSIMSVGNKYFLCAEAELTSVDKVRVVHGYAELGEHKGMSSEQTTGTASSYARKYALNGLFLIDETESDADSQKPQTTSAQPVNKVTPTAIQPSKSFDKPDERKTKALETLKKHKSLSTVKDLIAQQKAFKDTPEGKDFQSSATVEDVVKNNTIDLVLSFYKFVSK
jgi:hypothetical protein